MVYQEFLDRYKPKGSVKNEPLPPVGLFTHTHINDLFLECGGSSFRNGLYKTYDHASSLFWSVVIGNLFPGHKDRIIPFGFDWTARQFAVDKDDDTKLYMFDPAIVEAFTLRQDVLSFHNHELVDNGESQLDVETFTQVLSHFKRSEIGYNESVVHKVPLFLNGKGDFDNLGIFDNEIYWKFQSQLYQQTKNLPPGSKIDSVRFEP